VSLIRAATFQADDDGDPTPPPVLVLMNEPIDTGSVARTRITRL
jgi:hypothetical protein